MNRSRLTHLLKSEARRLGFARAGVCPAARPATLRQFHRWLASGYAGTMHYFQSRLEAYRHPRHVLDGVRSIVMLAMNYRTAEPVEPAPGQGRVSRYAFGARDYHDVIHERLEELARLLREQVPGARVRCVVDTAPLLEREMARRAGLGWIGKNTLLLNTTDGSWLFLAALLTDVELDFDPPHEGDHCGACRACLDACPTGAFPEPRVLDATRCISYLTIEHRESIPAELRSSIGDRLFGCDVCQEVCPWNRRAPRATESAFQPREALNPVDLVPLFAENEETFRRRRRHTPLWRSRRSGILRNAAVVLGNRPADAAAGALVLGLSDAEPLVRAACAWALGRYKTPRAAEALRRRLDAESNEEVRREIRAALDGLAADGTSA